MTIVQNNVFVFFFIIMTSICKNDSHVRSVRTNKLNKQVYTFSFAEGEIIELYLPVLYLAGFGIPFTLSVIYNESAQGLTRHATSNSLRSVDLFIDRNEPGNMFPQITFILFE